MQNKQPIPIASGNILEVLDWHLCCIIWSKYSNTKSSKQQFCNATFSLFILQNTVSFYRDKGLVKSNTIFTFFNYDLQNWIATWMRAVGEQEGCSGVFTITHLVPVFSIICRMSIITKYALCPPITSSCFWPSFHSWNTKWFVWAADK